MTSEKPPVEEQGKLVVVGASAGGVDALSVLVSTLPEGFPAPVVLAQHLDPRRRSNLEQILRRRSTLPVVVVQDGPPMALRPGIVYVVLANRHVTILDGHVGLEGDHNDRPRPSVDLLFSSAAQVFGENLIAVILTGSGSDGAAGAVEVSQAGGTVIIQNPQTAQFPAMPLALPPTAVDHVADLERIGPLLQELVHGSTITPTPETADPLRDILAHVGRQANIDFRQYKATTILRRIGRRAMTTRTHSLREYEEYLARHPDEIGELMMSFLIKVTEFFRDAPAYEYLRAHILPAIIEGGRDRGQTIRIWSAGCATGEEPYSLALLLTDMLGAEMAEWNIKIFATDLDENAINFARRGLYPANVLDNLPDDYRHRFFEPADKGYRISKALRQMVIFGHQDLGRGVPFPRIDLVVCRNVLIYFKPELQQSVLEMFAYSLHESGGYLFLGQAETARPSKATFELASKKWKIYRCSHGPLPHQPRHIVTPTITPAAHRAHVARLTAEKPTMNAETSELVQLRRFNEWVLRFLPIGVAVIDRSYHIVTINGTARRLLGIREMGGEQDFLHTARDLPYNQVRNAIDQVFREHATIILSEMEMGAGGNGGRFLTLAIVPMQADDHSPNLAVISITDVTESMQTRQRLEAVQADQKQLVDELSAANRRLSDLNKELQDANEELQASNEEMMLTQEELQATNEEFEATNEELQATNEELETNNEELQATNEELETTNEELTARTNELQDMTRTLADERRRLAEMVELAPFYIMMLRGPYLTVEAMNPHYAILLEGRDVMGRPLDEISGSVEWGGLAHLAREAYQQNQVLITPPRLVTTPEEAAGRYFLYTLVPTHESGNQVDGLVIYAEDISERVRHEVEERRRQFHLLVEHADQVAIGLYDADTHALIQASARYLDVLARVQDRPRAQVDAQRWEDLPLLAPGERAALFTQAVESHTAQRLPDVRLPLAGDGRESIWDFSLIPIAFTDAGQDGHVEFVVASAFEATEQIRAREGLEEIARLRDEFLALASHELRTPLVPLHGYAQLITRLLSAPTRPPDWETRLHTYVGRFEDQIRYLDRMVEDLFDIGRLQTGKLTLDLAPLDLRTVFGRVGEQCQMLDSQGRCVSDVAAPDRALPVVGDLQRLVQVGVNLVENALKHAPETPRIDLHLAATDNTTAELTVRDYGPGIPAEDLPHLFDRFYQAGQGPRAARRGLGLGLYIARQVIEQHGGTLMVDSVIGEGSTFTIRLPLAE